MLQASRPRTGKNSPGLIVFIQYEGSFTNSRRSGEGEQIAKVFEVDADGHPTGLPEWTVADVHKTNANTGNEGGVPLDLLFDEPKLPMLCKIESKGEWKVSGIYIRE